MTQRQAFDEIEQYLIRVPIDECVGRRWGWKYDGAWQEGYGVRELCVTRQLCMFGDFKSNVKDYAAQVNYTREILQLAKDAGRSVRRLPKRPARWPFDICEPGPSLDERYAAFRKACERAGYKLDKTMVQLKRRRKVA